MVVRRLGRRMSLGRRVEVIREQYTPRDKLLENRWIFTLSFKATVPKDSYIFIGGIEVDYLEARFFRDRVLRLADEVLGISRLSQSVCSQLVKKYRLIGGVRQVPSNIKLGDQPIIPASSLKGAVRSRLEYKFRVRDGKTYSCYCIAQPRSIAREYAKRHLKFWGEDVDIYLQSCNLNISERVCRVCDIFGAPGLASRVDFSDLKPTSKVQLDSVRVFGSEYKVIPPNTEFTFEATCRNFSLEDLGLLLTALELYTNSPIIIGRFKYRYNPIVGEKFNNQYYFGLLKIDLTDVKTYPEWEYGGVEKLLSATRKAIEHYIKDGYLDLERGVIKLDSN